MPHPHHPLQSRRTAVVPFAAIGFVALLALSGCGATYRPGVDGSLRTMPQNASSNAQPQPAGSLPR